MWNLPKILRKRLMMNIELICKFRKSYIYFLPLSFITSHSIHMFLLLIKVLKSMHRILDNLPVAVLRQRRDGSQSTTYEHGYRVGFKGNYQGVWIRTNSYCRTALLCVCFFLYVKAFICIAEQRGEILHK